ncbi:hypothetical protein IAT38_004457 [Cryptococcus sp. DSM 104549]
MGLFILLAQSVCMFGASFVVGSLPLWFKSTTSGQRLKAISVMGMGLLVGAALTIIIPEGVATLYSAMPEDDDSHSAVHTIGLSLLTGFALMLLIESLTPHPPHDRPPSPSYTTPPHSPPHTPTSIDSAGRPSPEHLNSQTPIISKHALSVDDSASEAAAAASAVHGLNATLGLVIHGAADGIALGASSLAAGGNGSLGLVVFLAVLVHKGPTALGLTTTLLSFNLSHASIRRRLFIFSCAAPAGAILTYLAVSLFGRSSLGSGAAGHAGHDHGDDAIGWWTGVALLFSGGSFLYVATVIQPLSSDTHTHAHSHSHHIESGHGPSHSDGASGAGADDRPLGKYQRTGLLFVGMAAPAVLSWIVGDAH